MPRICDLCARGAKKAANRSHSNVKTLRRQGVNLQKFGDFRACARCIRTVTKMAPTMAA